jgi:hypothetical protein
MNAYFQGAAWNLSERYTDMIKTLFTGLFYAAIFPQGLFITAFAMLIMYFVDKYSLLRLWRRPPMLDESLAVQGRHLIMCVVWTHLIITLVFFANWPYKSKDLEASCSLFTCSEPSSSKAQSADDDAVLSSGSVWTHQQQIVVSVYSIASIVVTVYVAVPILSALGFSWIWEIFKGKTDVVGDAALEPYRSLYGIETYLPVVTRPDLVDPIIAVNVSLIPLRYLPSRLDDSGKPVNANDLSVVNTRELPFVSGPDELADLFSTIKYYGPDTTSPTLPTAVGPQAPSPLQGVHTPSNLPIPIQGAMGVGMMGIQGVVGAVDTLTSPILKGIDYSRNAFIDRVESTGLLDPLSPRQLV